MAIDARPERRLRSRADRARPILVDERVIDHATTVDFTNDTSGSGRLQPWLASLDPDELGKETM